MDPILDRALEEAEILAREGLSGLLVENYGDAPFHPGTVGPETVAAMTVVVREVAGRTGLPVGVNVLRNDAEAALAVAVAGGGAFIRVNVHTGSMYTDQGLLQGSAHRTLRARASLGSRVAILADVLVKHATPPPGLTLEGAARDCWHRGLADGLLLTGAETGAPVHAEEFLRVREALKGERAPLWVGSGATPQTAAELLAKADGIIVGSALQAGGLAGGGVEALRVRSFMASLGPGEG